jgi:hypothetical protein
MKSWGLRRDSLSKYTALAASIYPLITTEAPIFYIACCTECFLILCLLYRNSIFTYSFSPFYDLKFNLFQLLFCAFYLFFCFLIARFIVFYPFFCLFYHVDTPLPSGLYSAMLVYKYRMDEY